MSAEPLHPDIAVVCLLDHLDTYTYKPGWSFSAEVNAREAIILAERREPDSCSVSSPREFTPLITVQSIPFGALKLLRDDPRAFDVILDQAVYECVTLAELHERDEWLKKNGIRMHRPIHNSSPRPLAASTPERGRVENDDDLLEN